MCSDLAKENKWNCVFYYYIISIYTNVILFLLYKYLQNGKAYAKQSTIFLIFWMFFNFRVNPPIVRIYFLCLSNKLIK